MNTNRESSRYPTMLGGRPTVALLAFALTATGCATMEQEQVTDVERMLAAAGFSQKLADTPEKLDHLKTLPQQEVTGDKSGDAPRFIYADAEYCQCLYVGDHAAYKRYKELAHKSALMDRQRQMTMWHQSNRMRWDLWGP